MTIKRLSYHRSPHSGMPAGRVFEGHKYAFWFHTETRKAAEDLKKEFTNPGKSRIRIVPKKHGYDIYGTYVMTKGRHPG